MTENGVVSLSAGHPQWPRRLRERLGEAAPERITARGALPILDHPRTALLCSARCPGDAILGAYDTARRLRDEGVTVISGFHAPIEKDCLDILLRGKQPIIICLARGLDRMRIPTSWRPALEADRLLLLSPFPETVRRATKETAWRRNLLTAALADDAIIIHAEPGGAIAEIAQCFRFWSVPYTTFDDQHRPA